MKSACLVLMLIGWAAIHGVTHASQATSASHKQSSRSTANEVVGQPSNTEDAASVDHGKTRGKPSDGQRDRHANLTTANRPKQLLNNRKHFVIQKALNVHQPSKNRSTGAVSKPAAESELNSQARSVRPPNLVPSARSSPNNARHRGPNPATVGGTANSNARNVGAINGTRMSRKP
jgi:hypothetical protein